MDVQHGYAQLARVRKTDEQGRAELGAGVMAGQLRA